MAIRMRPQPHELTMRQAAGEQTAGSIVETDWRSRLPLLSDGGVTLRQLRHADAMPLFMLLSTEEVARFISPPPATLEGFEQFIEWSLDRQRQGKVAIFAVVPRGSEMPVGLFQVRSLDRDFSTAECGFALGSPYWGSGLFMPCAELLQRFAFDVLGVRRLEARSMVENSRGNGALRKMGAIAEGILRQSFERHGARHDQYLWSIIADEWRQNAASKAATEGQQPTGDIVAKQPREAGDLWSPRRSTILVRVH